MRTDFDLANDLDKRFPANLCDNSVQLCADVEEYLIEYLRETVISLVLSDAKSKGQATNPITSEGFTVDKLSYVVKFTEEETALLVSIQLITGTKESKKKRRRTQKFDSAGRYDRVVVRAPEPLESILPSLVADLATLLEAGYRWLESRVTSNLKSTRDCVADELYQVIWARFPIELAQHVWFFALSRGEGFSLPNADALSAALTRISSTPIRRWDSPLLLLSKMTNTVFQEADTHSIDAISRGRLVLENFDKTKYADTGLQVIERGFYECGEIVVHPLVKENDLCLTIGYPNNDDFAELTVFLEKNKEVFRAILLRQKGILRSLVSRIRKAEALPGMASAFRMAGQVLGGLLNVPSFK